MPRSFSNSGLSSNPLPKREIAVASLIYAVATIVYLWNFITPARFASQMQNIDSVLMAVIADHTWRNLTGQLHDFWNLGTFHGIPDTMCLSEPMLTMAVLCGPIFQLWGYAAASNAWTYFCFWSLAMAAWILLRHLRVGFGPALWAGLFVSFCPNRIWHLYGHSHLYFQAGIFVGLLALLQALNGGSWKWKLLFAVAIICQLLSGFYMALITVIWVAPVILYLLMRYWWDHKDQAVAVRLRCLAFIPLTLLITAVIYLPLALHYYRFGKNSPEHTLESIDILAATTAGYWRPPASEDFITLTVSRLFPRWAWPGEAGENTNYLGVLALTMILIATLAGSRAAWMAHKGRAGLSGKAGFLVAVSVAGIICYVCSFGPFIYVNGMQITTPYGYLYKYVDIIHFFRSPGRYGIGLTWSVALLGAWAMQWLIHRAKTRRWGRIIAPICVAITSVEFFPVNHPTLVQVDPQPFTRWLAEQEHPQPFVHFPIGDWTYLHQFPWHRVPMINGYSGYYPANRWPDLRVFEQYFPKPETLLFLDKWGVRDVYLRDRKELVSRAMATGWFDKVWEDNGNALLRLRQGQGKSLGDYRAEQNAARKGDPRLLSTPLELFKASQLNTELPPGVVVTMPGMDPLHDGSYKYGIYLPCIRVQFESNPLLPTAYSRLKIRYKLQRWDKLRQTAFIRLNREMGPDETDRQNLNFMIHADGQWHDIEVPLKEFVRWNIESEITELNIFLGSNRGTALTLESLTLE